MIQLDKKTKKLSLFLRPKDTSSDLQNELYDLIKERTPVVSLFLTLFKQLPSLMLLMPITLIVIFLAVIAVWGDFMINWVFIKDNTPTIFGVYINEAAFYTTILIILVIYFFPVLLTVEQEGFIEALNARFANRQKLRKRLCFLIKFLEKRNFVSHVEIWNPELGNKQHDWVEEGLIPAIFDVKLPLDLHIRIDERKITENYIQKTYNDELEWEEEQIEQDGDYWGSSAQCIEVEFLEKWEKSLLSVYVFASTASLTPDWRNLEGTENDGVLHNCVSLKLVKILIERFKERLFDVEDLNQLISTELFASRCLNDYGILAPALRYTNDVWAVDPQIIDLLLGFVEEEMKYMTTYLQTSIFELSSSISDPVAAIKLINVQELESIYNDKRLTAIRLFIDVLYQTEQYKILKQYWHLMIRNFLDTKDNSRNIFRIVGMDGLEKLCTLFERAAMYKLAEVALGFIETILPFRGKVGKARIKERQGDFETAVKDMTAILNAWVSGSIPLQNTSVAELYLDIAWAIVSGRLEGSKKEGRTAIDQANRLLNTSFDTQRNCHQIIRLYNILANYEEWEGRPQGAIDNYNKALQIPGVHQSDLSNLLVNKGIAFRKSARLEDSALFGRQGVEIKTAIGDADQLPIALHNLAQTYLELAFSMDDTKMQIKYFTKATEHAETGLSILASTGSVKKKGQLLTEKFIGEYQRSTLGISKSNDLPLLFKGVQEWISEEAAAGRSDSYDCTVVVQELLTLLSEFKGNNVQYALSWDASTSI
jgi:tetratricopeptide (TPR) repeat protein